MNFVLILIFIMMLTVNVSYGLKNQTFNDNVKVIMVIVNRIDLNDLEEMPHMKKLITKSSIGLMNTRASGKTVSLNLMLL